MFLVQIDGKGNDADGDQGKKGRGDPAGQIVQGEKRQGNPYERAKDRTQRGIDDGPGIGQRPVHVVPFMGQGEKTDNTLKGRGATR